MKNKAIKVIKEIRKREEKVGEQAKFCRDHGFNMDAIMFDKIESELRSICHLLQTEFETGYVPYN
jgi:hypothetical protein